jgi:gamma-glutamylcyclotransferase (GGCT)/AIG2-like uncharacterized protein YtfP
MSCTRSTPTSVASCPLADSQADAEPLGVLIFSHGSLQEESVQIALYGRLLRGEPDELIDCVRTQVAVPAGHKAKASGLAHYANVEFTAGCGGRVAGTVFELTEAELAQTDAYEQEAEYVRVMMGLASGRRAWVYVSTATHSR